MPPAFNPARLAITDQVPGNGATGVQTLTVSGTPNGGTFRLRFGGYTTNPLAYNADGPTVQKALCSLLSIGVGGVSVSLVGSVYTATFQNQMARRLIPVIEIADNSLSGGTAPNITVAITTAGADASLIDQAFPSDLLYCTAVGHLFVNAAPNDAQAPLWAQIGPYKVTTTQRDALPAVAGLTVYNVTTNKLEVHNGTAWTVVGTQT